MAEPRTTGSHLTSSHVIRSFMAQPLDVIRPIRSSYISNNVYLSGQDGVSCSLDILIIIMIGMYIDQGTMSDTGMVALRLPF